MSLIDSTYFKKRLLTIPNLKEDVLLNLNYYISKYEDKYLEKMLGLKLKNQFLEGLEAETIDDKWIRLRDGYEYDISNLTYKWGGFVTSDKISPIANYVFCNFAVDNQSIYSGIGAVIANAENGKVIPPQYRVSSVWNDMVKMNKDLINFLYEFEGNDYPDWYLNIHEVKSLLSNDYFIGL